MNGREQETVFGWAAPPLKFGEGVLDEVGFAAAELGLRSAAVVTDPGVAACGLAERVIVALRASGIETHLFDGVRIEPTDASVDEAVGWAREHPVDGYVAVGGGSTIDTAKACSRRTRASSSIT